jgi:hypothetical protein
MQQIDQDQKRPIKIRGYRVKDGVVNVYDDVDLNVPYKVVRKDDTDFEGRDISDGDHRMNLYDLLDVITKNIKIGVEQIIQTKDNLQTSRLTPTEYAKRLKMSYDANFPKRAFILFRSAMSQLFATKDPPISLCVKTTRMYDLAEAYMRSALILTHPDASLYTRPRSRCDDVLQRFSNRKKVDPEFMWDSKYILKEDMEQE